MTVGRRHLNPQQVAAIAGSRGQPARGLQAHLKTCPTCTAEVGLVAALRSLPAAPKAARRCPEPDVLVLAAAEMSAGSALAPTLEQHLTACRDCAVELEGLTRAIALPLATRATTTLTSRGKALIARLRELAVPVRVPYLVLSPRTASPGAAGPPAGTTGQPFRQALVAYESGDFLLARGLFSRARTTGERDSRLDLLLGSCHLETGRLAAATAAFTRAVAAEPRRGERRWYLAQTLLRRGRGEEARAELQLTKRLPGPFRADAVALDRRLHAVLDQERRTQNTKRRRPPSSSGKRNRSRS